MIKKLRSTWVAAIVLVALSLPAAALPCYDMWRGCLAGGGGEYYCEGVWLGCMDRLYGSVQ